MQVPEWKDSHMKYPRRMLGGLATAGTALALIPATAGAAAPNPVDTGVNLCAKQGGSPATFTDETTLTYGYRCLDPTPGSGGGSVGVISARELAQADRLCVRNGGTFSGDPVLYTCTFRVAIIPV
jgi:hypothetical protein